MVAASWYFWEDTLLEEQVELMKEAIEMGVDGWSQMLAPSQAVLEMRTDVLRKWPDLVDDVSPLDPADFPAVTNPYPDDSADVLQRYLQVTLIEEKVARERELVVMARTHGLACYEGHTGRTDA
jgi:hypothetical protein